MSAHRVRLLGMMGLLLIAAALVTAQSNVRRLTTIDALRQFPGYYHLQNVTLRGELTDAADHVVLRADDRDLRVFLGDVPPLSGPIEVRGQIVDVGRLDPGDPRTIGYTEGRDVEHWPAPGQELLLNVTALDGAQPAVTPSVRALALEPWKFDGQVVTVTGNFRGRNLFGDLADAPGKSRYDFVLRSAEGAVWVSGQRPRGKTFDLDVDRRLDTSAWLQVTGTVTRARGLVTIEATQLLAATAPDAAPPDDDAPPPPPPPPAEVIFSSPTEGEVDVSPATTVRIQFSRGLRESTIDGHVAVTYADAAPGESAPAFKTAYDAATRALTLTFAQPLQPFRTLHVATLDGLAAFDGAAVLPWSVTWTVAEK